MRFLCKTSYEPCQGRQKSGGGRRGGGNWLYSRGETQIHILAVPIPSHIVYFLCTLHPLIIFFSLFFSSFLSLSLPRLPRTKARGNYVGRKKEEKKGWFLGIWAFHERERKTLMGLREREMSTPFFRNWSTFAIMKKRKKVPFFRDIACCGCGRNTHTRAIKGRHTAARLALPISQNAI